MKPAPGVSAQVSNFFRKMKPFRMFSGIIYRESDKGIGARAKEKHYDY